MIETPEYAVNPKSLNPLDGLSDGDTIPVEQNSGFGGYIDRIALVGSLVMGYVELTATTAVDVSARFSDVFIRVTGSANPTITISGTLQPGRKLVLDVRSATNGCTFVIGGLTYTLVANDGICVFHCTSAGWARPNVFGYRVHLFGKLTVEGGISGGADIGGATALDDLIVSGNTVLQGVRAYQSARVLALTVDNDATIGDDLTVTDDATVGGAATFNGAAAFNGNISPRDDPSWSTVTLAAGATSLLPRGALFIVNQIGSDPNSQFLSTNGTTWIPFLVEGGFLVFSSGSNMRLINPGSTTQTYYYQRT